MFTNLPESNKHPRRLPIFFTMSFSYWILILGLTIVSNILMVNPVLAQERPVMQLSGMENVEMLNNGGKLNKERFQYPPGYLNIFAWNKIPAIHIRLKTAYQPDAILKVNSSKQR